ncbi:MAG: hypothetical protein ACYDCD_14570, partial [Candidatus Acidiferrales bacterium]
MEVLVNTRPVSGRMLGRVLTAGEILLLSIGLAPAAARASQPTGGTEPSVTWLAAAQPHAFTTQRNISAARAT